MLTIGSSGTAWTTQRVPDPSGETVGKVLTIGSSGTAWTNPTGDDWKQVQYSVDTSFGTNGVINVVDPGVTGNNNHSGLAGNLRCVFNKDPGDTTHGLKVGDRIKFTGGTLPSGISGDILYYVTSGVGSNSGIDSTQFGISEQDYAFDNYKMDAVYTPWWTPPHGMAGLYPHTGNHITSILQNWGVNYPYGEGSTDTVWSNSGAVDTSGAQNTGTAGSNLQVTKATLNTIAVDNLARVVKAVPGSGIFVGEDPDDPQCTLDGHGAYTQLNAGWILSLQGGTGGNNSNTYRSHIKWHAARGDGQAQDPTKTWDMHGEVVMQAYCRQFDGLDQPTVQQKSVERVAPICMNPLGGYVFIGRHNVSNNIGARLTVGLGDHSNNWGAYPAHQLYSINAEASVLSAGTALTSDDRLKFDETPLENALDMIEKLSVKRYKKGLEIMTPEEEAAREAAEDKGAYIDEIGVIAQEMNAIPEWAFSVHTHDSGPWHVNYSNINMVLLKAVQELSARVKQLESNP